MDVVEGTFYDDAPSALVPRRRRRTRWIVFGVAVGVVAAFAGLLVAMDRAGVVVDQAGVVLEPAGVVNVDDEGQPVVAFTAPTTVRLRFRVRNGSLFPMAISFQQDLAAEDLGGFGTGPSPPRTTVHLGPHGLAWLSPTWVIAPCRLSKGGGYATVREMPVTVTVLGTPHEGWVGLPAGIQVPYGACLPAGSGS